MKKSMTRLCMMLVASAAGYSAHAESVTDSLTLQEVVVTGTRNATDVRHLPMTVTVIGRETLTEQYQTNVLPTVMQQVPGLFVTSRSMMGYGVSTGGSGGINLPGVTIGDNVTIGAGSVVTKDIPSNSVAVGNPCKVIKTL